MNKTNKQTRQRDDGMMMMMMTYRSKMHLAYSKQRKLRGKCQSLGCKKESCSLPAVVCETPTIQLRFFLGFFLMIWSNQTHTKNYF
jgi:hypothetical protein